VHTWSRRRSCWSRSRATPRRRGTARVTVGDTVKLVQENESIYITATHWHRLENPGKVPLEIIEVQIGSYLGEDDIIRADDAYNRGPNEIS